MATYIKLEWSNNCDLGDIYYAGGFENKIYLDADIGKPEYEYVEEGQENGDAVFTPTVQKRIKKYRFEVFVPEYLVDALMILPMHDTVRLTITDGSYSSEIRNIEVTPNFETISEDCMALVEIKFQQDDQLVDTNCCTDLSVTTCYEACLTVVGYKDAHPVKVTGSYYIDDTDSNTIYEWTGSALIAVECDNDYVYSNDAGGYLYFNGDLWLQVPSITTITQTGGTITVKGYSLPGTWVQVYYSNNGVDFTAVSGLVLATEFQTTGKSFTPPSNCNPFTIKFKSFNHTCDYGFSETDSIQIGPPCP